MTTSSPRCDSDTLLPALLGGSVGHLTPCQDELSTHWRMVTHLRAGRCRWRIPTRSDAFGEKSAIASTLVGVKGTHKPCLRVAEYVAKREGQVSENFRRRRSGHGLAAEDRVSSSPPGRR